MQFSTILLLATTALAAALPQPIADVDSSVVAREAEADPQYYAPQYQFGTCSPSQQMCYLQYGGAYQCDPAARCSRPGGPCTFSSTNAPGANAFATSKANCQ